MAALVNLVNLISGINERKRAAHVRDAQKNFLTDPDGSVAEVMKYDPDKGMALDASRTTTANATFDRKRKVAGEDLGLMGKFFRDLPEDVDVGLAIDEAAPMLTAQFGVDANAIQNLKTAAAKNPNLIRSLDDDAYKEIMKGRYDTKVATPGSYAMRDGKIIAKVPFGMKTVTTRGGDGASRTDTFDPNTGDFNTSREGPDGMPTGAPGAATPYSGGPLTVDGLRQHFKSQENGGSYTGHNKETGALGAYQVMPETGRNIAAKLKLAWRPDMMEKDDPASIRYQDAIGGAAIKEALDNSGGDPETLFKYYYGGSNRDRWGPKTRKYANEMMDRLNGGEGNGAGMGAGGGAPVTMAGKTPKHVRAATAEDLKGYPEGTAAQVDETGKLVNVKTPPAAQQKALAGQADRARDLVDRTTAMIKEVVRLRQHPGLEQSQGVVRGHLPDWMTGQEGTNFRNAIKALRSNIGLDRLLEFKAGSAQGASGFGNLSNAEGDKLEKKFGNLAETNDTVEMRRIMDEILTDAAAILRRQETGFKTMKSAAPAPSAPSGVKVTKW